jgi:anti-sigma B factor antagonist
MSIEVVQCGNDVVLVLDGELDLATAPLLDEQLAQLQASDAAQLLVDLDRVAFIDSTGLGVLVKHARISSQNGQRLRLTRGSPQAQRLFELAGVWDRLPFLADPI